MGLGLIIIVAAIFSGALAPQLAAGFFKAKIMTGLSTDDVQVDVAASPPQAVLWGELAGLKAVAHQAKIGDVYMSQIDLNAKEVRLDMLSLFDGSLKVNSAESLLVKGYVTEENLRELISRKVDKLEDIAVKITPQGVTITAAAKIMGRKVEVELEGAVLDEEGAIYFRVKNLRLTNSLIGTAKIDSLRLMDDIMLTDSSKLPLEASFKDVTMKEGKIIITAER